MYSIHLHNIYKYINLQGQRCVLQHRGIYPCSYQAGGAYSPRIKYAFSVFLPPARKASIGGRWGRLQKANLFFLCPNHQIQCIMIKKSSNAEIVIKVPNFSNFILFKDRSRSAEKSMISYFETLVILHLTKKNLYPFLQEFKKILFSIFI